MSQILSLIQDIYPQDYHRIQQALSNTINQKRRLQTKVPDWYKKLQFYVVYPDAFHQGWKAGLDELREKLPYIKKLGLNAIHVLPFLSSPQIDAGFDVNEYYLVRENLGGNLAFDRFISDCEEQGIAVFMDLVLNHISYQHRWFLQAVSGDRFYRKFFYTSWEKPNLIERYSNSAGEWAAYDTDAGRLDMRIIFPEQAGEVPHWYQAEDGYWYYHTFYPQQLDVNWNNYHVFVAYTKVIAFWAKKGLNFRLDAVPFVGKEIKPGLIETSPRTHQIVTAVNLLTNTISPDSVFLVEANQPTEQMIEYFGKEAKGESNALVEAHMAYNFPLMNQMWGGLISQQTSGLVASLKQTGQIPQWGTWVNFLRNHDELSLEFAGKELHQIIYDQIIDRGLPFRGDHDIAGRTMSLLGDDENQFLLAYFLLASMPGCPAIIYGDELGKTNDFEFMKQQTEYKRSWFHLDQIQDDTRDINRGFLDDEQINKPESQVIYTKLAQIFNLRQKWIAGKKPSRVKTLGESVLEIKYKDLTAVLNLGLDSVKYPTKAPKIIFKHGSIKKTAAGITLGPQSGLWVSK